MTSAALCTQFGIKQKVYDKSKENGNTRKNDKK